MTISREARIIIGILVLIAAGFVWLTYFNQTEFVAIADRRPADAIANDSGGPTALPAAAGEEDGEAEVADQPAVAREVEIAELPFLVTEPPAVEVAEEPEVEDEPGLVRPAGERRATVNPFAPIIVRQPAPAAPAAVAEEEPERAEPTVVDVPPAPSEPAAAAEPARVTAPAPSPLAPPAPRTASLPRALPAGTLPVTLEPLQTSRAVDSRPQPDELAEAAAKHVPEPRPEVRVLEPLEPEAETPVETETAEDTDLPDPIADARDPAVAEAPLFAGANGLARYLRDHSVAFTGAVHGPVGFGIFRSATSAQPLIVGLGQTLPGTDIVLTDLQGQQAELTQGDFKQTLILDLRR